MSGPGRSHRKGLSFFDLMEMFPDEQSAVRWFEEILWVNGRCCGHCGSTRTRETPRGKPMPYWCSDCRSYFSVRTGTALACTRIPLRKWVFAIYTCVTSLKSVSSMKLHRDIRVGQTAAWYMMHRLREAWAVETSGTFEGPVEADETYIGGKAKNMHAKQRRKLTGRGGTDKMQVVGIRDRNTKQVRAAALRHGKFRLENDDDTGPRDFVLDHTVDDVVLYTDESPAYKGMPNHEAVTHSTGEYVRGMAHTNGMESFWSMLKRAYTGTFHKLSPKHLDRYVQEFAGRHNIRDAGTLVQMCNLVSRLVGCRLMYEELIADNGLPNAARPMRRRD